MCNIEINFMFGQIFDTTERKNVQNNDEMLKYSHNHAHGAVCKGRPWTQHMCLAFDVKCEKLHHLSSKAVLKL